MRDNHERMPEILSVTKQEDKFFCTVGLEHESKQSQFQFGVSYDGYLTLCRLFEMRPFDQMPGVKYRYFWAPAYLRINAERMKMTVRIELGQNSKQLEIEAPTALVANLKWFFELDDFGKAEHLQINHQ